MYRGKRYAQVGIVACQNGSHADMRPRLMGTAANVTTTACGSALGVTTGVLACPPPERKVENARLTDSFASSAASSAARFASAVGHATPLGTPADIIASAIGQAVGEPRP